MFTYKSIVQECDNYSKKKKKTSPDLYSKINVIAKPSRYTLYIQTPVVLTTDRYWLWTLNILIFNYHVKYIIKN